MRECGETPPKNVANIKVFWKAFIFRLVVLPRTMALAKERLSAVIIWAFVSGKKE